MAMHTISYFLVACLLSLATYGTLCWALTFFGEGFRHPWTPYIKLAFLAEFVLIFSQLFFWTIKILMKVSRRRRSFSEGPPLDFMTKFGFPLLNEGLKMGVAALIVFSGNDAHIEGSSSVFVVSAVFAGHFLLGNLIRFCPVNYHRRFARFLAQYEIYAAQIVPKAARSSLDTLAPDSTLNGSKEALPEFNLDSFSRSTPLAHSVLLPVMTQTHTHPMIDRMYSVSPKNTLHCLIGQYGREDDLFSRFLESYGDKLVDGIENMSVHSSDTHFGGGGGGSFSYELPGGSKLRFGGGGGFDYNHKHSSDALVQSSPELAPSDSSYTSRGSTCCSNSTGDSTLGSAPYKLSVSSSSYTASETTSVSLFSRIWALLFWFRWLVPLPEQNIPQQSSKRELKRSIRKTLSTYTLTSDTTSLKASSQRLYGTMDLEGQVPRRRRDNVHVYYAFTKFANKFFDLRKPHIVEFYRGIDPAFCTFGTLLPNFSPFFFVIQACSLVMWQLGSTMIVAYPFVASVKMMTFMSLATVLVVSRLFCINYLRNQATCSYRVSLVAELVVYGALFTSALHCYLYV